uniref:7TM_GPCR_Srx domain-containing protein n=1 Tax=Caenorhabditis tropicalis TaxID=1561998 RepID=A0A1I7U2D9_9PELO
MLELPASAVLPRGFFIFAVVAVFIISLLGSTCDVYLFYKFVTRNTKPSGFQKLCTIKSITNFIICSSFLFWVVPVTSLSYTFSQVNPIANRFISILAATSAYFMNSFISICMSCNRFYALFFPFGVHSLRGVPATNWALIISFLIVMGFSFFMAQDGCACLYDPNTFVWKGEEHACSDMLLLYIPLFVVGATVVTNSFNVACIVRLLLMNKMTGMNVEESRKRRKRWMVMFVQSVTQDCLQLADIISSYQFWDLYDYLWWQFLTVTLSFLSVTAIDGFVMFICQSDVHPKWLKRITKSRSNSVPNNTL